MYELVLCMCVYERGRRRGVTYDLNQYTSWWCVCVSMRREGGRGLPMIKINIRVGGVNVCL